MSETDKRRAAMEVRRENYRAEREMLEKNKRHKHRCLEILEDGHDVTFTCEIFHKVPPSRQRVRDLCPAGH